MPLPSIAEVAPGASVPPGLEALIQQMLAKNRDERIQTIEEIEALLHDFLASPNAGLSDRPITGPIPTRGGHDSSALDRWPYPKAGSDRRGVAPVATWTRNPWAPVGAQSRSLLGEERLKALARLELATCVRLQVRRDFRRPDHVRIVTVAAMEGSFARDVFRRRQEIDAKEQTLHELVEPSCGALAPR